MRVAIDAAVLGSGRGGDESYLRAILAGLAELTPDEGPQPFHPAEARVVVPPPAPSRGRAGEGGKSRVVDSPEITHSLSRAPRERDDPRDVFPLLMRSGASIPPSVRGRSAFPVRRVDGPRLVRYAATMPRALAREPGGVDLIHSFLHAPLFTRVPSALNVTDLSFLRHPEYFPPLARLRLSALVPWQARRARIVITLTEFCRRDIIDAIGIAPERVAVVPAAVLDLAGQSAEPDPCANAGSPYFLYLGNLHPRKNVPRLIEAFLRVRRLADELHACRLVIAGAPWWGGEAERQVARAAPPGAVEVLGRVSDAEREALLRGALALVYPSLFEGFGLPPVEAMAVGTPVLASNTSALPEVLGDAALLVDPTSTDAIAAGLVQLATQPALRTELRRLGLKRAARYTPRATGEAVLAAFHAAL